MRLPGIRRIISLAYYQASLVVRIVETSASRSRARSLLRPVTVGRDGAIEGTCGGVDGAVADGISMRGSTGRCTPAFAAPSRRLMKRSSRRLPPRIPTLAGWRWHFQEAKAIAALERLRKWFRDRAQQSAHNHRQDGARRQGHRPGAIEALETVIRTDHSEESARKLAELARRRSTPRMPIAG